MILNSIVKTHFISLHIIKTKRHCYFFKAIGRKEDTEKQPVFTSEPIFNFKYYSLHKSLVQTQFESTNFFLLFPQSHFVLRRLH